MPVHCAAAQAAVCQELEQHIAYYYVTGNPMTVLLDHVVMPTVMPTRP